MKVNLLKESRLFHQAGSLVIAVFVGISAFTFLGTTPTFAAPPTPPPQRTPTPTPTPTPGTTPDPGGGVSTTTICYHGTTMVVRTDQLGNFAGYTPGACSTSGN